jgi:hypothetical protein
MRSSRQALLLSLFLFSAHAAHAYTIDGNLSDWGVQRTGQASDWAPNANIKAYTVEDHTGNRNTFLSPGYGGQAYDAEAIYLDWDKNFLYIAIATGHNPLTKDTGVDYAPGDIAIDFDKDGTWDFGIALFDRGDLIKAGHVYTETTWDYGLWSAPGVHDPKNAMTSLPTSLKNGTDKGKLANVAYTTVGQNNFGQHKKDLHYFYEIGVPIDTFSAYYGKDFNVQWTMNCANDAILVDPPLNVPVPEPGTLALMLLGLTGVMSLRLRKKA